MFTYRLLAVSRGGIVYRVASGGRAYCVRMAQRRFLKGRAWLEKRTEPARTARIV